MQPLGDNRIVKWLAALFALAAVISLVTDKAFYRGVIEKEENPGRYWQTIASYLILVVFFFVMDWYTRSSQ